MELFGDYSAQAQDSEKGGDYPLGPTPKKIITRFGSSARSGVIVIYPSILSDPNKFRDAQDLAGASCPLANSPMKDGLLLRHDDPYGAPESYQAMRWPISRAFRPHGLVFAW